MAQKFFKDSYEIDSYLKEEKQQGNHRKGCKCILCKKRAENDMELRDKT